MESKMMHRWLLMGVIWGYGLGWGDRVSGAECWNLPDAEKKTHPARGTAADPATYPDADGFQWRREQLLRALAGNDLEQWRRGYFKGGDPGKYLPGAAMARLLLNPDDAEARKYMNDERSPKEHYHFAALNWARFIPAFGAALDKSTWDTFRQRAATYTAYLNPSGTENHKTMNLFAAAVLCEHLDRIGGKSARQAQDELKKKLRDYVQGLYTWGQGEWDSPTYLMFNVHGLLNVYDFSDDEEMRLLAAAGLDWFTATYALKFRSGLFTGPNQRGHYTKSWQSIADQTGWIWWGGTEFVPEKTHRFLYAIHPATSAWKPNAILTRLARKEIAGLPAEQRNTKPNYWFGAGLKPQAGTYEERLWLARTFTLGSLQGGFGGQITRLHLVAATRDGEAVSITGGHPRKSDHTGKKLDELTYADGGGRYDQIAQFGPTVVLISDIPREENVDRVFVSAPDGEKFEQLGELWVVRVGQAFAVVRPLGEAAWVEPSPDGGKNPPPGRVEIRGRPAGFILHAVEEVPDAAEAAAQLRGRMEVDDRSFADAGIVRIKDAEGIWRTIRSGPQGRPVVDPPLPAPQGMLDGPWVRLVDRRLTITDGKERYEVDFRGPMPVYR